MRYMVEQVQVIESTQKTVLSGLLIASRFTKLTSVPIPHLLPGEAKWPCSRMNSVEPTLPAASTVSIGHSGWTMMLMSG